MNAPCMQSLRIRVNRHLGSIIYSVIVTRICTRCSLRIESCQVGLADILMDNWLFRSRKEEVIFRSR